MTLYNNKYRIESARLEGFDYGSNGAYHITICTKNRLHHFGEIVETDDNPSLRQDASPAEKTKAPEKEKDESVPLNGGVPAKTDRNPLNKTDRNPLDKTDRNPLDKTDYHPSLRPTKIGEIAYDNWLAIPNHFPFASIDSFIIMPNHIHGIILINKQETEDWSQNKMGGQSRNIPSIIRAFKGSVKRYANTNNIEFEWQERYHDRIIRDYKELENTRLYIFNNSQNWINDEYKN